jgi:hypothetical protein
LHEIFQFQLRELEDPDARTGSSKARTGRFAESKYGNWKIPARSSRSARENFQFQSRELENPQGRDARTGRLELSNPIIFQFQTREPEDYSISRFDSREIFDIRFKNFNISDKSRDVASIIEYRISKLVGIEYIFTRDQRTTISRAQSLWSHALSYIVVQSLFHVVSPNGSIPRD